NNPKPNLGRNHQKTSLADHAAQRARSGGVQALGHAAGEPGFAAGGNGFAHRFGHEDRVGGFGDGGVHEDAVGTQFHGHRSIGSGAYTRVDNHRDFRDAFAEDAEVGGILNAEAGANRRCQGHDGGGAGIDEFAGGDQIVIRVREDHEAFFYQDARGFKELLRVGEKSLLVADDFQLDPIGEANFAG